MSSTIHVSKPRKTQQLSLRLTDEQRAYVRDQLNLLRRDGDVGGLSWSEADVIRAIIENARRNRLSLKAV